MSFASPGQNLPMFGAQQGVNSQPVMTVEIGVSARYEMFLINCNFSDRVVICGIDYFQLFMFLQMCNVCT